MDRVGHGRCRRGNTLANILKTLEVPPLEWTCTRRRPPAPYQGPSNKLICVGMSRWDLAILAHGAVQSLTTPAYERDPYDSDVRPPREPTPIKKAVIGVLPPILGIHAG
jgi:hypothetical protein